MGRLDPSPRGGAAFFHFWGANEPTFSSTVNHIGPRIPSLWARDQREGTWPGGKARIRVPPQSRVSSPGLLPLTTMPGQFIVRVVGAIGLAMFASTPAFASDVSAMSCSQIGGFARQ